MEKLCCKRDMSIYHTIVQKEVIHWGPMRYYCYSKETKPYLLVQPKRTSKRTTILVF